MSENPEVEYTWRLEQRQQELTAIRQLHRRLWNSLLICGLGLAAASYVVYLKHWTAGIACALLLGTGVQVLRRIRGNAQEHSRVQRIADFYELGLKRISGTLQGQGICGEEFQPEKHLYSADLDLFGRGSAFEMLCTARSAPGRKTLAEWMLHAAGPVEISQRQAAVMELRNRLELREYCASLAGGLEIVDTSGLRRWLSSPGLGTSRTAQIAAFGFPVCTIPLTVGLIFRAASGVQLWPVCISIAAEVCVALALHRGVRRTMDDVGVCCYDLALLAPLLERFEKERFECPLLQRLQHGIRHSGKSSAKEIRKLKRLVWLLNLRRDEWTALAGSLFLWATNVTIQIDRWRLRHQDDFAVWADSIGQLEALLCLARYSYENPSHTFPSVHEGPTTLFRATGLGHPLLKNSSCVRCDLELGNGIPLLIVTGSNMGGKSTLLRSVGLNAVLAFMGAPVRAIQMEISCFQVAGSICVRDSLLKGKSRFFAEVERLKWIIDTSRTAPTLFLLDEVLSGTNSKDRLFGTEAVIRQLLEHGAVGLVTSHDLALTELANSLSGRATNVHFEEQYQDGEMRFDYRMRPGALTRTNGINIMSALGLLSSSTRSRL